jgi:hypothetical protein
MKCRSGSLFARAVRMSLPSAGNSIRSCDAESSLRPRPSKQTYGKGGSRPRIPRAIRESDQGAVKAQSGPGLMQAVLALDAPRVRCLLCHSAPQTTLRIGPLYSRHIDCTSMEPPHAIPHLLPKPSVTFSN